MGHYTVPYQHDLPGEIVTQDRCQIKCADDWTPVYNLNLVLAGPYLLYYRIPRSKAAQISLRLADSSLASVKKIADAQSTER